MHMCNDAHEWSCWGLRNYSDADGWTYSQNLAEAEPGRGMVKEELLLPWEILTQGNAASGTESISCEAASEEIWYYFLGIKVLFKTRNGILLINLIFLRSTAKKYCAQKYFDLANKYYKPCHLCLNAPPHHDVGCSCRMVKELLFIVSIIALDLWSPATCERQHHAEQSLGEFPLPSLNSDFMKRKVTWFVFQESKPWENKPQSKYLSSIQQIFRKMYGLISRIWLLILQGDD